MPVRFGTDGIRGRASDEITTDLAYRLGRAVASVFSVPIFVGYDTRESSPALAAAVLAGLDGRRGEWRQPRLLHDPGRRGHRSTTRRRGRGRLRLAQSVLRQRLEGTWRGRGETRPRHRGRGRECAQRRRKSRREEVRHRRDRRVRPARLREASARTGSRELVGTVDRGGLRQRCGLTRGARTLRVDRAPRWLFCTISPTGATSTKARDRPT